MNDIPSLSPTSTKEWLMHLSGKIDNLEESQAEYTDTLADFMKEVREWKKCKDEKDITYYERVDNIDNRVKGFSITTVIVSAVAAIMGFFGVVK
jgi:hypothetical protein